MYSGGVLKNLGLHVSPDIQTGTISSRPGPMLASSGRFMVTIRGKGGDAAFPHLHRDPVLAASMAIIALQQIIQRETDPLQPKVLTVGLVESNHAPEVVTFGGTFRSFTSEEQSYIQRKIKELQIIEMQAAVHGCTATVDFMEGKMMPYPLTINDEALYEHAKRVGEVLLGKPNVKFSPLIMAAEDFSFYTQKMAGFFLVIGMYNEKLKSGIETHSPYFVIDAEVLPIGAAFHAAVAMAYFDSQLPSLHGYQ